MPLTLRFARSGGHGSVRRVTGAILNAAGILAGSLIGLARTTPLSAQTQAFFKVALGVSTVFYGLRLTWLSLGGPFALVLKQILIACLAVMFGKLLGRLLHFQFESIPQLNALLKWCCNSSWVGSSWLMASIKRSIIFIWI